MKVEIARRAQRSIARIDTRWRKQADHPEIFRAEQWIEVIQVWDGRRARPPKL